MAEYIDKSALIAEIERLTNKMYYEPDNFKDVGAKIALDCLRDFINTLEVKEVDINKEISQFIDANFERATIGHKLRLRRTAKYFFELGLKAQHDNWKVVDNTNLPQVDRTKKYCVFTKQQYILATVINHPQDEDLLQWKCTEFPHHRYDMCEGDKYMQIV